MTSTPQSPPRRGYLEGSLFLALSLALFAHSLISHGSAPSVDWALSPYLFPLLISVFLFVLSVTLLWEARRGTRQKTGHPPVNRRVFGFTVCAGVAYYFLMPVLGFVLATALFLTGMFYVSGECRPLVLVLLPVAFAALTYLLFARLLYVMLPFSVIDILRMGLDALMGG